MVASPLPFAFYGTLRPGGGAMERLGIEDRATHLGPCLIRGELYAVAWYPGLVDGPGVVRGDLFAVPDDLVPLLDEFEGHRPDEPDRSEYVREPVTLVEPSTTAWVYRWRRPTPSAVLLPDGDWLAHAGGVPLPSALEL